MARQSSSIVMTVLPWVAIGGLLYLMASNKKASQAPASSSATPLPSTRTIYTPPGCTATDFGVTGCWCG